MPYWNGLSIGAVVLLCVVLFLPIFSVLCFVLFLMMRKCTVCVEIADELDEDFRRIDTERKRVKQNKKMIAEQKVIEQLKMVETLSHDNVCISYEG